jgi:hypothetical protein
MKTGVIISFFALKTTNESRVDATEEGATEHDAMSGVTRGDVTDNARATITVDDVLDELLDNIIEAYGSSARDVYGAIFNPGLARTKIDKALTNLT